MKFPKAIGGVKWPIWNRRNLAITTGCGVLLLVAFGHAASPTTAKSTTPTPTTTTTTTTQAAAPQTAPAYTPDPTTTTTDAAPDVHLDMMGMVTGFATAWAQPQLTRAQWQAGIAPWVTPALAKELSTTDPARVPATRVLGDPVLEKYAADWSWAWVRVTTDGGDIIVSVVSTSVDQTGLIHSWLVSNVAPADPAPAPAPTAAPTPKGTK